MATHQADVSARLPMGEDDRIAILGQDASGGMTQPAIALDVSPTGLAEPPARVAPDLVGLDFLDAHSTADAHGLRLAVWVWETSVGPWGRVLDQQPAPGTRTRRGAKIRVVVSGRPQVQVPDVCGLSLDDAIERLTWFGFVPLVAMTRASRSLASGPVVATRPSAGEMLSCGSVVALTVSGTRAHRTRAGSTPPEPADVE